MTPLNEKLKNVEWGEFRIGELFEIGTGSLLPSNELIDGKIPRISAKSDNNGILGYYDTLDNSNARHFENFITVNFFGTDGGIFYHPYKASIEMKVHTLKIPSHNFNRYTGTFIAGALKQNLTGFDYGSQLSSSKLKKLDLKIQLPIKNGNVDFDFMERFVAEIKKEQILKLENYLNEIGLSDYDLTKEENEAIKYYSKLKFNDFNVIDVFNVKNAGNILSRDIIQNSGDTPYLCASSENNGVSSYISYDEKYLDKGDCIFIGGKTFVVSYQAKDYFSNDSHNLALYLKEKERRSKLNQLFLTCCIDKSLSHIYSWG
jgi:hypothetical protein